MNYKLSNDYEAMYHGAVNAGIQYLLKHKSIKSLVIGVSGGIDSAVVCMLANAICDKLLDRRVKLIGRSISIESNKVDEEERARGIGKAFCDYFEHLDLTEGYYVLYNLMMTDNSKIRGGNIKARLRMMYLYNLASKHDGLVLSTDNLTEYMLGFWTLHGDVGDFGLIQNLWKTEVYGLAQRWIDNKGMYRRVMKKNMLRCINAVPTDGLGITKSDLDQLLPGYRRIEKGDHLKGYKRVDDALISYFTSGPPKPHIKVNNAVIERYLRTQFKRNNPASVDRNLLIP